MQLYLISTCVVVAFIAIGTIDASPSPIRYVTPKPGIRYPIRIVTPNPRIRYLRSTDQDQFSLDATESGDLPRLRALVTEPGPALGSAHQYILKTAGAGDKIQHAVSKRSPERVVINWKPPPANGPRHARSADAEELIEDSEE